MLHSLRLAQEGRFEFVQGGWVQNDEANTHYFAIFNQMLDGHDWLKKNIPGFSLYIILNNRVYKVKLILFCIYYLMLRPNLNSYFRGDTKVGLGH